jgi:hypothetical protein
MARSSALALALVLAACSAAIVPAPSMSPETRIPRTYAPTPFDPITLRYPATAAAFLAAFNEGREADAYALLGEHFIFGNDCDYLSRRLWYMTDREAAGYWLHVRIVDHDRVDVLQTLDSGRYESALRFEVRRSSDSIRNAGYPGGSVVPRAKLVMRFSLDGSKVIGWGWEFDSSPSAPLRSPFPDCLP